MKARLLICALLLSATARAASPKEIRTSLIRLVSLSDNLKPIGKVIDLVYGCGLEKEIPISCPLKDPFRTSSPYGMRKHPISGKTSFHSGVDLAVEFATPVFSTANGTVVHAGRKGGYGRCVIIRHSHGYSTLYGHLAAYYTTAGKEVKKGDAIGFVGSTGRSTGNHLHYEVKKNNKPVSPIWYDYDNKK